MELTTKELGKVNSHIGEIEKFGFQVKLSIPNMDRPKAKVKAKSKPKAKSVSKKAKTTDVRKKVSESQKKNWATARRYAKKHNVSVSEARSILSKEKQASD